MLYGPHFRAHAGDVHWFVGVILKAWSDVGLTCCCCQNSCRHLLDSAFLGQNVANDRKYASAISDVRKATWRYQRLL